MNDANRTDPGKEEIRSLILHLEQKDGLKREHARHQLEKMGRRATPLLLEALQSANKTVRWEAVKALQVIKDRNAVASLIERLYDPEFEVRWLASEALIQLGYDAVILPLLTELKKDIRSEFLRNATHHILRILSEKESLPDEAKKILCHVWSLEPELDFYKDVLDALERIKQKAQ
ncbi:MAG TPA: HEAT repeat domain-containing protein [Candidatus Omnitrophota bacterium]|nr:HEAT repeat domain-containing protein [Candidatus Omnitrophota bacterium]